MLKLDKQLNWNVLLRETQNQILFGIKLVIKVSCANWKLFVNSVIVNYNLNLDFYSQSQFLKLKITNQKAAGQYQCSADNGIDEKQYKIITVNVNGMFIYIMNFALSNIKFNSTTKCGAKISVLWLQKIVKISKHRHCECVKNVNIVLLLYGYFEFFFIGTRYD